MAATGSCLCGAITFEIKGPLRAVINCHCSQCRKWTGHYVAATAAWKRNLYIRDSADSLRWYRSSFTAQRGFCGQCGSSLFWQRDGADTTTILAGTLDGATGLNTAAQIYVSDKGDYYCLSDPQAATYARTGHSIHLTHDSGSVSEKT